LPGLCGGEMSDKAHEVLDEIRRVHGQNSIMLMGEGAIFNIPVISTGILPLDVVTGVGGLPRGRMIEVYGPESSGKTTLCLTIIAQAQKEDGLVAFIDTEHSLDPSWAETIGVQVDDLLLSQPECGEEALEIMDTLVKTGDVDVIILDSVAALVSRAELEGSMGQAHVGLQARLMSQAMRKLAGITRQQGTLLIFTNQIREKVGIKFGNPEVTPGGRALKFYSTMRIETRRRSSIKGKGDEQVGIVVGIKVVKNKVAPPFKNAECSLLYDYGFDKATNLLDCAMDYGIVDKRGAWISFDGEQLGQGKVKAADFVRENEEVMEKIKEQLTNEIYPAEIETDVEELMQQRKAVKKRIKKTKDETELANLKGELKEIDDKIEELESA